MSATVPSRVLLATSSRGNRVAQALPDDDTRAATWVRFMAESLTLAAELHPGEEWAFEVVQDSTVERAGREDETPLCSHCGESMEFVRAADVGGGVSHWRHVATRTYECADGFGHADRPDGWKAEQLEGVK